MTPPSQPEKTGFFASLGKIFDDQWKKLVGAGIGLLLTAGVALLWHTPVFGRSAEEWTLTLVHPCLPKHTDADFVVLIGDFQGDDFGRSHSELIGQTLGSRFGSTRAATPVRVLRWWRTLRWSDSGDLVGATQAAQRAAQRSLRHQHADVLVWGRVWGGSFKRIRIGVARADAASAIDVMRADTDYSFDDITQQVNIALAAAIAANLLAGESDDGRATAQLAGLVNELRPLRDAPTDAEARASFLVAFANAAHALGARTHSIGLLEEARDAQLAALHIWTKGSNPSAWATTTFNLASTYSTLAVLKPANGVDDLHNAERLYLDSETVQTRDRDELLWAQTESELGAVRTTLAMRTGDTTPLAAAVANLEAASSVLTQADRPVLLARARFSLGTALLQTGVASRDNTIIQRAVTVFRSALGDDLRQAAADDWARMQDNLGAALSRSDAVTRNDMLLRDAAGAHRAALQVWSRSEQPADWAFSQNALAANLVELGQRSRDATLLRELATRSEQALQALGTQDANPIQWGDTQDTRATALTALGERSAADPSAQRAYFEGALVASQASETAYRAAGPAHADDARTARRNSALLRSRIAH